MGKVIDFGQYKTKQVEKINLDKNIELDSPKIYITKLGVSKYNIIVSESGKNTLFNQTPMPSLAVALYAASYCKDKLSEYLEEFLSTDIINFDEECSEEMNSR